MLRCLHPLPRPAVGLLAAHCAFARGAQTVVLIDRDEYRLEFARKRFGGQAAGGAGAFHTINFKGPPDALCLLRLLRGLGPGQGSGWVGVGVRALRLCALH